MTETTADQEEELHASADAPDDPEGADNVAEDVEDELN